MPSMSEQRRRALLGATGVGRLALTDEPLDTDGAAQFATSTAAPVHAREVLDGLTADDYVDSGSRRWPICRNRHHAAADARHAARELGELVRAGRVSRSVEGHYVSRLRDLCRRRGIAVPASIGTR